MAEGGEGECQSNEPDKGAPTGITEAQREQIKLGATYLNGIAIGLFLVGGLSIPASILLTAATATKVFLALLIAILCLGASPLLHRRARRMLTELDL